MYKYYNKKRAEKNITGLIISILLLILFIFISELVAKTSMQLIILILIFSFLIVISYYYLVIYPEKKWKIVLNSNFPKDWKKILENDVEFYQNLNEGEKDYFENRVQYFLLTKKITGVDTDISDRVKILVASSAIIPVFAFPYFEYDNINEILIYPQSFDEEYNTGNEKRILGMVGDGAMNRMMILSKKDILSSFNGDRTMDNVALHEFVHLIDKKDGVIDGFPGVLMNKTFILPWLKELQKEIVNIKRHKSDINPYAMTNESEFLAVASEYFFMSPRIFEKKHPKLYKYFSKIYRKKRGSIF